MSNTSQTVTMVPDNSVLLNTAKKLADTGRWQDAVSLWRGLIAHDNRNPQAFRNLGLSLAQCGQWAEAIEAYAAAHEFGLPADELYAGLGFVFSLRNQFDIAQENLETALRYNPHNIAAWNNLLIAYSRQGLWQKSLAVADHILTLQPDSPAALSALGSMHSLNGEADTAIKLFRRVLLAAPQRLDDASNLLWAMLHSDQVSAQDILAEARTFAARLPSRATGATPSAPPAQQGKLRIGWVSADLRRHPVGLFVIPMLAHFNSTRCEHFVYDNATLPDALSEQAKSQVTAWHSIAALGDHAVAALIRLDGINILFDLSGHTAGNRLPLFASRAAPVQISWLGYTGTTGLAAMDYILVPPDPVLLRGEWCNEKPIAIGEVGCHCVRDASKIFAGDSNIHPFEDNGWVTFGSLNNFRKVSPTCVSAWSRILQHVENSRLMLTINSQDQNFIELVKTRFAKHGIHNDRLYLLANISSEEYSTRFRDIDIALDPFPCNGGTTTFDTLFAGVPVICLAGEALHSRMSATIVQAIGLTQLIATTIDDYVDKAIHLAESKSELKAIRQGLPERVRNSPLTDLASFANGLESLLHAVYGHSDF
jgi:protein O-GlcNAc transferase